MRKTEVKWSQDIATAAAPPVESSERGVGGDGEVAVEVLGGDSLAKVKVPERHDCREHNNHISKL